MVTNAEIKRLQRENMRIKERVKRENLRSQLKKENFALRHRKGIGVLKSVGRGIEQIKRAADTGTSVTETKGKGKKKKGSTISTPPISFEPTMKWRF